MPNSLLYKLYKRKNTHEYMSQHHHQHQRKYQVKDTKYWILLKAILYMPKNRKFENIIQLWYLCLPATEKRRIDASYLRFLGILEHSWGFKGFWGILEDLWDLLGICRNSLGFMGICNPELCKLVFTQAVQFYDILQLCVDSSRVGKEARQMYGGRSACSAHIKIRPIS